jgi:tRNA-dihydrouridine synthase 4
MTIANSFCRSERCRQYEFTTNEEDTPMIVQFAANCKTDYVHATEMIQKYADGVDLNCGCPQSWAMQDGYGSYLLKKPEVIEDMMKSVRRNVPASFSVSIKIRLLNKDLKTTIDFCRKLETLNPTFITIHGRTPSEKSSGDFPVDVEAIAEIKKSVKLPVIFNGDVTTLEVADNFHERTKCDGMMAARSILTNPALFAGHHQTPLSVVQDWIDIHHRQGDRMTFQNFHHHLVFMMEHMLKKQERNQFNDFTKKFQCLDFLKQKFGLEPKEIDYPDNTVCIYDDSKYKNLINQKEFWDSDYSTESSHGQYFLGKLHKAKNDPEADYLDNMGELTLFD